VLLSIIFGRKGITLDMEIIYILRSKLSGKYAGMLEWESWVEVDIWEVRKMKRFAEDGIC